MRAILKNVLVVSPGYHLDHSDTRYARRWVEEAVSRELQERFPGYVLRYKIEDVRDQSVTVLALGLTPGQRLELKEAVEQAEIDVIDRFVNA